MHILMIAPQPFFRPRGTPFSVLHRTRALLRLGHTVELVTYPFGETPELAGLTIHRSVRPLGVRDVKVGPSAAKLLLDLPLFRLASRLARTGRFDLIHTHEEAGMLGARLGRSLGLPHLYDMHSSLPQQFSNFGRFNWPPVVAAFRRMEDYTLAGADAVIAICPELGDYVRNSRYRGPLAVIENTLDFDVPDITDADVLSLRRQLGVANAPLVVYTGTLESYQGLDLLIESVPQVLRALPEVRFVLVGGTPEQIAELRRLAEQHDAGAACIFVPAVPPTEVFRYHRIANVLATTRIRGMNTPLKIYQYLRAEKPIVATDIPSHTQVLDPASAELVAPTAGAVAAGLVRVLTDPVRGQALAARAARLAEESYSEASYMRSLESLLAQLRVAPPRPAESARPDYTAKAL
jgi:glycosyltransferase involved in cell wall biosynthesis